jgi:hypothetical protein
VLKRGDIINMELAAIIAATRRRSVADLRRRADRDGAQVLGRDHAAHKRIIAEIAPGKPTETCAPEIFPRTRQSRPTQCHGIDLSPTTAR